MRVRLLALALLVTGSLAAPPAHAEATARVVLHRQSIDLRQTGFAALPSGPPQEGIDYFALTLEPGGSADLVFDYSVSVSDDGLPVVPENPSTPPGCTIVGRTDVFCGPPKNVSREAAAAMFFLDGFSPSPFIRWTSDGPLRLELGTNADSFADSLSQSGTIRLHVTNDEQGYRESVVFDSITAAWLLATPIPEPTGWLQMAAGLGLLGLFRRSMPRFAHARRGMAVAVTRPAAPRPT